MSSAAAERIGTHDPRFPRAKFRPATLPATLVPRPELYDRLSAGAGKRLTVVVGSAGAGKSVLLASWAAGRPPGTTCWLSCDEADANPVRFWTAFAAAAQAVMAGCGADAADLLALDGAVSADVTASITNDVAKLPPGSAIVVDDLHYLTSATFRHLTDLVERWPAGAAQLVLSSRADPPLRLHRLRMAGELCELRNHDLCFSLSESRDFLAKFGVDMADGDLALLHQRSEGWAAALQMAALSLRGGRDPARVARALEIRSHEIADYFVAEVLDRQPAEVVRFMLDTSILGELTEQACAAVTGRQDAAALLHGLDAANLFVVALDDDRTSFRYHQLAGRLLRAELRARNRLWERTLQLRAAESYQAAGDARTAARHLIAAGQPDRALALLRDQIITAFLADPALPPPLDLGAISPALLAGAPDRLLALVMDLLLSGDTVHAAEYLELLDRAASSASLEPRLAARREGVRSAQHMMAGRAGETVREALAARVTAGQARLADDWIAAAPMVLLRAHTWLEDLPAVEREAAAALATPELTEPVKQVMVPGAQALAWFEAGQLARARAAAMIADQQARQLGFDQHFFAVDYLRALAGLALEQREADTAERLTERALSISERGRPAFEFLARLDRAAIWAARGQVSEALATLARTRQVLAGTGSELLSRADELEALLRLSLGEERPAADLAGGLPAARRELLLARIALAAGEHQAAQERLASPALAGLTPRLALVRQLLLAAAAIGRADPVAAGLVGDALQTARWYGFCHTVVSTAAQVTSYLVRHAQSRPDPYLKQLIAAALQVRAAAADPAGRRRRAIAEPLTAAERRILRLLPTSSYLQMAAALYISRNTVKAHLRSIYRKLGVSSRPEAIERAVELRLL